MSKQYFLVLAALIFSVSAIAADKHYVLGVDGLACPFCAYGIEKRLNKVDGVTDVQVDVGESLVRVTLEETSPGTAVQNGY
mgnify:CR=1 FL=1